MGCNAAACLRKHKMRRCTVTVKDPKTKPQALVYGSIVHEALNWQGTEQFFGGDGETTCESGRFSRCSRGRRSVRGTLFLYCFCGFPGDDGPRISYPGLLAGICLLTLTLLLLFVVLQGRGEAVRVLISHMLTYLT